MHWDNHNIFYNLSFNFGFFLVVYIEQYFFFNFVNHDYLLKNHNLPRVTQQLVTKLIGIQDVFSVIRLLQNMTE